MKPQTNTSILVGILCTLLAILVVEVIELQIDPHTTDPQKINEQWFCEKWFGERASKSPIIGNLDYIKDSDHVYHHCLKYLE